MHAECAHLVHMSRSKHNGSNRKNITSSFDRDDSIGIIISASCRQQKQRCEDGIISFYLSRITNEKEKEGENTITFSLELYNLLRVEIKSLEGTAPSVSVCKTCQEQQKDCHLTIMFISKTCKNPESLSKIDVGIKEIRRRLLTRQFIQIIGCPFSFYFFHPNRNYTFST